MADPETYLGDGVYCTFDGYNMILDLRAQGPDQIVLEPATMLALFNFAVQNGWKPTIKGLSDAQPK